MEYDIQRRNGFVAVATHGDGEVEVFQEFLNEVLGHSDWKPGTPILIDHSDLNAGPLTTDEVKRLADMINIARFELGPSLMAVIVPGDLEYGLFRMWQVYIRDRWNGTCEILRSSEDAVGWLMHD